jgi:hypothetical protein
MTEFNFCRSHSQDHVQSNDVISIGAEIQMSSGIAAASLPSREVFVPFVKNHLLRLCRMNRKALTLINGKISVQI